jgi:hypothetical protein
MREIRTSGSMSGEGRRSDCQRLKPPRPSSTLPLQMSAIHLVQVAMTAGPFMTDHLFLSAATTVKQLGLPPFQVVQ